MDLSTKTVHVLSLMRTVIKTAGDFWTKYQCNEILDIKYVTVDSDYSRQNILTEMLLRSLSLARIFGLKVCIMIGELKNVIYIIIKM